MNHPAASDPHIWIFFLLAYLISWALWITLFAMHLSQLVGIVLCLYLAALIAPHLSAILMSLLEGGRARLREFYRLVTNMQSFVQRMKLTIFLSD